MRRVPRFTPLAALFVFLLALVVTALAVVPAGGGGRARAQDESVEFEPYLRRSDGRSADPVNVIFVGEREAQRVALLLVGVMRWAPIPGSDMAFVERGTLRWTQLQLGAVAPGARKHIRLAGAEQESARWGSYTLAAVHRDVDVECGHVGAAFDEERNALAQHLGAAGYSISWLRLGNDGPVEHCDGRLTRGDGWVAVVDLRRDAPATPSATPTATPTATPSPTPPPATPRPTPTPTPSPTPSPTPTATSSPTPSPAPSPTVERNLSSLPR
jgi:hypothetical protein